MAKNIAMSAERLGQIVEEASSEVYVFSGDDFKFVLVNRGARDNIGYSAEELLDFAPWDIKPLLSRQAFIDLIEPLTSGKVARLDFETVHQRKSGSQYDVSVRLQYMDTSGDRVFFAAIQDITESKITERALRDTSARLDAILSNTTMAVLMMDDKQHCVFMNKAAEELTGYTLAETRGRTLHDVIHHTYPDGRHFPIHECAIDRAFPENNQTQGEEIFVRKDGSFYPVGFTASPVKDQDGRTVGTVIEARNIEEELRVREAMTSFNAALKKSVEEAMAERDKLEAQLVQSQKMEAIGQLTGGVAHDFNNLLQVISGNLQMLHKNLPENDEKNQRRLSNALAGVERGAKLAAQLLAFGRQQALEPKPVNIGRLVRGMDDMLRRTLGEAIEIETVVAGGLWNCLADPAQVENVILNLAINARDAMEARGKLTIETGNASLDDSYAGQHHDVTAGQYVMLAVTDTGTGMTEELLEKVFEPFFTTKGVGEGTGLGLSMVYGFVKQSGGHIKLYSEVGQGTTVRIYFPRTKQEESRMADDIRSRPRMGDNEVILVAEDDDAVRATACDLLTDLGYKVLEANNADNAMAIINSGAAIDLLFTDVVMPGKLPSPELARKAKQRLPDIAVLFTSGYTQNAIVHAGRLDDEVELISKPYNRDQLARKIEHVLSTATSSSREHEGKAQVDAIPAKTAEPAARALRILLLEDEPLISMAAVDMLEPLGHRIFEAGTIAHAQTILATEQIDVMIADLGLPDGSGSKFVRETMAAHSSIKIIVASGSPPPELIDEGTEKRLFYVPKPYDEVQLRDAVTTSVDQNY